jgi:hypothetical protein
MKTTSKILEGGLLELSYKKEGIIYNSNDKLIVKFEDSDVMDEFH